MPALSLERSHAWWRPASLVGRPEWPIAALWLAALLFYLTKLPHPDVAWYLVATDRLLGGGVLYRDIVEVNPPLAFYLHVPPVALARLTGLDSTSCLVVYLFTLIAIALAAIRHLLRRMPGLSDARRSGMLLASFGALSLLPLHQVGQREHLLLILGLPYLFLVPSRLSGADCRPALALTIGAVAALGFGLKPHFLIAPLAIEFYYAWRRRTPGTLWRPEICAGAFILVVYAGSALHFWPDYFDLVLPMAASTYPAYGRSLLGLFLHPAVLLVAAPFLFVAVGRRLARDDPMGEPFMIAAAAFFASYVVQAKGWEYQLLPAAAMTWLAGASLLIGLFEGWRDAPRRPAAPLALSIAALVMLLFHPLDNTDKKDGLLELLLPAVGQYAPGGVIHAFSHDLAVGFPLVNASGAAWGSRFPSLWPLYGVAQRFNREPAPTPDETRALRDIARYVTLAVTEDFERRPPDLVIVEGLWPYLPHFGRRGFDYVAFFQREARFARLWADYRKVAALPFERYGETHEFQIWVRE